MTTSDRAVFGVVLGVILALQLVVLSWVVEAAPAQGATYLCAGKHATIVGTQGADRIKGTSGRDVIAALGGADTIAGVGSTFESQDYLCGGRGADTIYVATKTGFDTCAGGVAFVAGGKGNDKLFGGGQSFTGSGDRGDDLIDGCNLAGESSTATFYTAGVPVTVKLWDNSAIGQGMDTLKHIDSIYGSPRNDQIMGSYRAESLSGAGGADTIKGGRGSDFLFGGDGVDTLDSRDGVVANDTLDGEDDFASCLYDSSDEGEDHAVNCNE